MNILLAVLVIVGLLALRMALPLALAAGFSYGMNRMVDRWEG